MMINDDASVTLVYDMAPGLPRSQRVVRLENVNGMLEVIYDTAVPSIASATTAPCRGSPSVPAA